MTCKKRSRFDQDFVQHLVNSSLETLNEVAVGQQHRVFIPMSALIMAGEVDRGQTTVVATVINSSRFQLEPHPGSVKGRAAQPNRMSGSIMDQSVLVVRAGKHPVQNLLEPVRLTFLHNLSETEEGTCVFWQDSGFETGTGFWITDGCDTNRTASEFVCTCNHLSFFAVLVNPVSSVAKRDFMALSYISYIGSALSVVFTIISLIIYKCTHRRPTDKSIGVHMNLTVALLFLHLSFLVCCFLVQLLNENWEDWVCPGLGLLLHWSLLATFSWMALEGFHIYLLLIRVFNIYIRRYLLKVSLVGWGLPTLTVAVCWVFSVYGKHTLVVIDDNGQNSTAHMCWLSSDFPQMRPVYYTTTVTLPCSVVLSNCCLLVLVVFKLRRLRREGGSSWRNMCKDRGGQLVKDCTTVLGLSCVLGLTWAFTSTTYVSVPGMYIFTVLNSLQGVFMFLWSLALISRSRADNSSLRYTSSQKMMMTSFNSNNEK